MSQQALRGGDIQNFGYWGTKHFMGGLNNPLETMSISGLVKKCMNYLTKLAGSFLKKLL